MKRDLLNPEELADQLTGLPGWQVEDGGLVKTYRFPSYLAGVAFVTRLAEKAEAMDHHPDLRLGWRRVEMRVSTHSAGGITALDTALAREAEMLHGGRGGIHEA